MLRFKPDKLYNLIVLRDLGRNLCTPCEIAILLYVRIKLIYNTFSLKI